MQDKSIDGALLALRKQIIRENLDGLEHVEALLLLRGVDMPAVLPAKLPDAARRGHMRLMVLEALRDGPKPLKDIAAHVSAKRSEISYGAAYSRCGQCLAKMKKAGLVRRGGRFWLAP